MKTLRSLAIGLIAISLSLPLWSGLNLVSFVQPERQQIAAGQIHSMFSYENFVHEAGFGRISISLIALLILFVPYRKGVRWAFVALGILAVIYYIPVFFFGGIPNLGTWAIVQKFPQPKVADFAREYWSVFSLTVFLLLGLIISAPAFFRRRA